MTDSGIAEAVARTAADIGYGSPVPMSVTPRWSRSNQALAAMALNASAVFWFLSAVIGQAIFLAYVVSFYGGAVISGDLARINKLLVAGYIRGDSIGNLALATHIMFAALIVFGGPLQLIPKIRANFPCFHRWNGRVYLVLAVITSIAGTYMVWTRNVAGDIVQHLGTTSNALVIVLCAVLTVHYAIAGDFGVHRRWALRLFIVVSGVWFFRVALMFSMVVNGSPFGFDPDTFQGPFLSFLAFAQYLVPLAILEVYLRVRDGNSILGKFATMVILSALTVAMGVGIFAATVGMWLPRI